MRKITDIAAYADYAAAAPEGGPEVEAALDRIACFNEVMLHEYFWYGLGPAIVEATGLSASDLRATRFQHGVTLPGEVNPWYLKPPKPLLTFRQDDAATYTAAGVPALAIGAPHLYAKRAQGVIRPDEPRGTLVFLSHSTHHIETLADFDGLAANLQRMTQDDAVDERLKPFVAMVYWKDALLGRHAPFLERGIRCLTAGHMFDTQFIAQFYTILREFHCAAGDDIGTAAFLAAEMGLPFLRLGSLPHYVSRTGQDSGFSAQKEVPLQSAALSHAGYRAWVEDLEQASRVALEGGDASALTALGARICGAPHLRSGGELEAFVDRHRMAPSAPAEV